MRYDALGYEFVLLPMLPSNWNSWNVLLSTTIFIQIYKNQIILHINVDFHYKAMYNYRQLVSLLFSLLDWMSLYKNDDWCTFVSNTLKYFLPMTGFLDTEIAPAIKPNPQNKGQNVDTKSWLWYTYYMLYILYAFKSYYGD